MPHADRRLGRAGLPTILAAAMLSVLVVFTVTAVSVPTDAFGASITKAAACGANLRTRPYTTARQRATIKTDTRVTVATSVVGGSWRLSCAGKTLSGKYWYRISAINGKSVRTLYGVSYLYAATGLFTAVAQTKYAACPVALRTSAATTATRKTRLTTGTKVTVVAKVAGGSWRTYCNGIAVAGKYWYRIRAINGRSVKALYGVTYLYAPSGLFRTPASTPAPTPTPAPTTSTTGRPFAAPVTSRTVDVPSSIDSTGATNAAAALQSFIGSVPDGSIIVFKAGGVYRMDRGLAVENRHDLVFEGNGATLRSTGTGVSMWADPFVISGSPVSVTDIAIRNFVLTSTNPRTGTDIYDPSHEAQHGVGVYGGSRIEIANSTINHTWGDGVYAANGTTQDWVNGLWVHDTTFSYIGRNAFTLNAARNALLERNTIDQVGAAVLDIEPDLDYQGVQDVTLRNNSVGVWGKSYRYTMFFVACANQTAAPAAIVDRLTISGNNVTVGAPSSVNTPNAGGLAMWIGRPARQTRVVVTNNTTTKAGSGPVLRFEHVDGLTVTGNNQPLTSGSLTRIYDSTNVIQ